MSKIPTLILSDEINCQLVNFSYDIISYFNNKFQYEVPSARFSSKFQLGIWDGMISFFSKNGNTFIYLLPKIIPDLVEIGIKFEILDDRNNKKLTFEHVDKDYFSHIIHPDTALPLELRQYQIDAVNKLLDAKSGILVAATGAGKTTITAALCKIFNDLGLKALVIVPTVSLVKQTKATLVYCELDVGELSGKIKDPNHMTVVSTWQTLQNIKALVNDFQMVVCDENHGAKGAVIKQLLGEAGKNIKYRFGLTGTMPKDLIDRVSIQSVLGEIVYTISARKLIDEGHLADLHINITQLEEDFKDQYDNFKDTNPLSKITYSKFKESYFPDYQAEKSYLRTSPERLEFISNNLIQASKKGNVFALVDSIAFGKKLEKLIKSKSDKEHIYFVSGKDDVKLRQEIYNLFKDNDNIIVIATVHCAGVGTDISRIYQLFIIDLGKSFIRTIQAIGRGLRKAKDKDYIDIIDICSDLKYSKRHVNERIKFYKEAEYPYTKIKTKYLNC